MEKTIKIGKQDVKLDNNIGWAFAYKSQFGTDIIPTIMPLVAGVMDVISGIIKETGTTDGIAFEDIVKVLDGDSLLDAYVHLSTFEFTDIINITWALAKCADNSIPEPTEWVKQFDTFPVDVVVPAVAELIYRGVVSSKNLKWLNEMKKKVQPKSNSTKSSSQESKED